MDTRCNRGRRPFDTYYTPPEAVEALLRVEGANIKGKIWEPCCGDGAIAKYFPRCMASDIRTDAGVYGAKGVDFLRTDKKVDTIVTNPPLKLAYEFIVHALTCAQRRVYLLLPLAYLEGVRRGHIFDRLQLERIYVFRRNLSFDGSHRIVFAWYVWDRAYKGQPKVYWI